jgi:xanthine dehydrogenase accessory factor
MTLIRGELVVVRGAGDLATGTIVRLVRAGFRVVALEVPEPTAIRRTVSLGEAVYQGTMEVEGVRAARADRPEQALALLEQAGRGGPVPILVDPRCTSLERLRPAAVVDAILAKRNLGTRIGMAPTVVALGPGFEAGVDAHAVVETQRGHDLGRVLLRGKAAPDTGVPGLVGGFGWERVLHAPHAGVLETLKAIGDQVRAGEPVARLVGAEGSTALAPVIDGVLRGLLRGGCSVPAGMKLADVDPRGRREHCFTISDKARSVAGGVLEALIMLGERA